MPERRQFEKVVFRKKSRSAKNVGRDDVSKISHPVPGTPAQRSKARRQAAPMRAGIASWAVALSAAVVPPALAGQNASSRRRRRPV
jgi:hypothetical protein